MQEHNLNVSVESLLTTSEVANELQVSRNSVTAWVKRGQLSAIKLPSGQFRIPASEVRKILEPINASSGQDQGSPEFSWSDVELPFVQETAEAEESSSFSDSLQQAG